MLNNGDYTCRITTPSGFLDGVCHIGDESMSLSSSAGVREILFADIMDIRLVNYHVLLHIIDDVVELTWLGKDTEDFFENIWAAVNKQAEKALFTDSSVERQVEADYAYNEVGGMKVNAKGRAKIKLYPDAVCIFPHDKDSRRIPLCFVTDISERGYELTLKLDTGDSYTIARMGQETTPFVTKLRKFHSDAVTGWQQAHIELEKNISDRLGDRFTNYEVMSSLSGKIISGLFSPDAEQFYFAIINNGRAAVELVLGESSATYLYEFDCPNEQFIVSLRHAMEAVNKNREIIYADVEMLREKPLYRMAIGRCYHLSFLRSHMSGKIIHNSGWEGNLRDFLV